MEKLMRNSVPEMMKGAMRDQCQEIAWIPGKRSPLIQLLGDDLE